VGLDRSTRHFELFSDLRVVTALEQQLCNLLLSGSESNRFVVHYNPQIK
jgi:hypothetical protein